MLRLGLVDFDTSHVVEFTKRLHGVGVPEEQRVAGARVVAGCPGESAIMPERIEPFTEQLRELGVEMVRRPEDLLETADQALYASKQRLYNRISRHLDSSPGTGSIPNPR